MSQHGKCHTCGREGYVPHRVGLGEESSGLTTEMLSQITHEPTPKMSDATKPRVVWAITPDNLSAIREHQKIHKGLGLESYLERFARYEDVDALVSQLAITSEAYASLKDKLEEERKHSNFLASRGFDFAAETIAIKKELAALRESSVPKEKVDRLVEALRGIMRIPMDPISMADAKRQLYSIEQITSKALAEFEGKGEL